MKGCILDIAQGQQDNCINHRCCIVIIRGLICTNKLTCLQYPSHLLPPSHCLLTSNESLCKLMDTSIKGWLSLTQRAPLQSQLTEVRQSVLYPARAINHNNNIPKTSKPSIFVWIGFRFETESLKFGAWTRSQPSSGWLGISLLSNINVLCGKYQRLSLYYIGIYFL